jgi:hypothetical protein
MMASSNPNANNQALSQSGVDNSLNMATSMKLAAQNGHFNTSSYLEHMNRKNIELNYEKFNPAKPINMSMNSQIGPITEAASKAKAMPVNQVNKVEAVEEVTFKVEKMEDKPVVISNHFEGDVTKTAQMSALTGATNTMFGTLLANFV